MFTSKLEIQCTWMILHKKFILILADKFLSNTEIIYYVLVNVT